ncbi:Histone H2A.Z-specific chaperone [Coccidioides immitis]|nr:Histone H2A.Z-specific chaperone [Coccidioides immitis]
MGTFCLLLCHVTPKFVRISLDIFVAHTHGLDDIEEEEEAGDDNLERISEENIIPGGRRTRGKVINFAEAAEKVEADDAMDDDDDEEYKQRDEDDEMQG